MELSSDVSYAFKINIPKKSFLIFSEHHEKVWKIFIEKKIPVEICLTSNVLCGTEESYEDHNIRRLLVAEHPLTICVSSLDAFYYLKTGSIHILIFSI